MGDTHLAMAWTGAPLHASMGGGARKADTSKEGGESVWAADAPAPSAKPLVAALLAGWRVRIDAVLRARRAYAAALHLAPGDAGAWGDLASAYFAEAQLRRAHRHFAPQQALVLRSQAERLLRGETMQCNHPDWFTGCMLVSAAVRAVAGWNDARFVLLFGCLCCVISLRQHMLAKHAEDCSALLRPQ